MMRERTERILRSERRLEDRYMLSAILIVVCILVGFGDLTAVHDPGRLVSAVEAFGQLYLVSVVALLVSNVGRVRRTQ